MLAGTLAISGYNIADTWFVSSSTDQLAAGIHFPAHHADRRVYRGLCVGVMTPTAHSLGGGRRPEAARLVTSGLMLMMLASLAIGTAGALTIEPTFRLCGAGSNVMTYVVQYMLIWYFGSFTGTLGMAGNDLLIAAGDSFTASMLMLFGLGLNVLLDPLFIFGWCGFPVMGIAGAALATVISQAVCGIVALRLLYSRHRLIASPRIPRDTLGKAWKTIIRFAVPAHARHALMRRFGGHHPDRRFVRRCGSRSHGGGFAAGGRGVHLPDGPRHRPDADGRAELRRPPVRPHQSMPPVRHAVRGRFSADHGGDLLLCRAVCRRVVLQGPRGAADHDPVSADRLVRLCRRGDSPFFGFLLHRLRPARPRRRF